MNNTDAVTALAALAQDSRLAIVRLLIQNALQRPFLGGYSPKPWL